MAPETGDGRLPDFGAQCEAMLEAGALVVSSIMGVPPIDYFARLKARGISWFATATTLAEARTAKAARADAIVAQAAHVRLVTIARFEAGARAFNGPILARTRAVLEAQGVEFTQGVSPGAKLEPSVSTIASEDLKTSNDE